MPMINIPDHMLPTLEAALFNGALGILDDKALNAGPRGRRDARDQADMLHDLRLSIRAHREALPPRLLGPRAPAAVIGG